MSLRLDGAMYMHMHTCTQVGRLHLLTFSNRETSALLSRGYRMIWWLNCLKTQKELEETRRIITAHYVQVSILSIIFFQVLTSLWGRCYSPLYRWGNWGSGKLNDSSKVQELVSSRTWGSNQTILKTSLVVQWLRFHAPKQGAWVRSLVGELDPTCCN